ASLVYLFSGHGMSFAQAFNGAGDTDTPTWINIVVFWFCRLPLAYGLALPLGLGLDGVLAAMVVSMAVWAFVGWRVFRRGRCKLRTVWRLTPARQPGQPSPSQVRCSPTSRRRRSARARRARISR